ncbi:MAG: fused MFS/spermidine synthase [Planctomycetota bacterium]|nr:fused MFS/spermidine synthase [Planctomycetota bacterium]
MVLELVAGRLIAPHSGSSLYTWTSIIGVIMGGMSIGNVLGGRVADRWQPQATLGWIFLAGAAICLLTLGSNSFIAGYRPFKRLDWPAQILFSVAVIFGPAAIALGSIFPVAAKMALEHSLRAGATLGSFYAWGVVGSLLGTFLTGFLLVQLLGCQGVMLAVVTTLALTGLAMFCLLPGKAPTLDTGPVAPAASHATGMEGYLRPGLYAWRYTPCLVTFFAGLCLMTVEILAGRLLYRQAGSSLYTWTSVIGVVLAGVSAGNFLGGRMADRRRPHRYLGWLFLSASAACLIALFLNA